MIKRGKNIRKRQLIIGGNEWRWLVREKNFWMKKLMG
jgi:hypothetical protein